MSEFDSPYSCEFTYSKRAEGKNLLARMALLLLYIAFVGGFFAFCYFTRIVPLFAVCPIFLWMLIFFTWRYVSYDYYFEFRSGLLTIGKLKVRKKREIRTPKYSVTVKDAKEIYPIPAGRIDTGKCTPVYDFSGSVASDKRIAIVSEKSGRDEMCILECTRPLAKMIMSYNKTAELAEFMNRL